MVSEVFRFHWGDRSGGADRFENLLTVSVGGKDSIFTCLDLFFTNCFSITLLDLFEEMAENSQPAVKTVNIQ